MCGASLEGRDRRAKTCSASCRREASRIRRLSAGLPEHGYASIDDYRARARRCVQNAQERSTVPLVNQVGARRANDRPRGLEGISFDAPAPYNAISPARLVPARVSAPARCGSLVASTPRREP